jgi:long-chain acyl-CoA synthetase
VGLLLPNCPAFLISYYAVLKTGASVVNINPLYAGREIRHIIDDAGIETIITLDLVALYPKAAAHLGQSALKRIIVADMAAMLPFPKNWLFPFARRKDIAQIPHDAQHPRLWALIARANTRAFEPPHIDAERDVAVIQYTGGTTGVPKGAMLSHASLVANVEQVLAWVPGIRLGGEKMLGGLPFFHVFAMTVVMNLSMAIAAEIVMLPRFDVLQALDAIHRLRCTIFPAVPTIYSAMNVHPKVKAGVYDITSLRYCVSGGASLPVEVLKSFESLTGCLLIEGYGLTEAGPVCCGNPIGGGGTTGSIGLPMPGTLVEIVSTEDRTTVLPPGEKGEICIRGPQVMLGYWNKPEETAIALADGRLHTGDIGYMDARGYTVLVDREKDIILIGGYNVFPRIVEEQIQQHPAVEEVIVGGVADKHRGQMVKAFIKLKPDHSLTVSELRTFLKDRLSAIEIPRHIDIGTEPLPRTLIGKLSRKDVLAQDRLTPNDDPTT